MPEDQPEEERIKYLLKSGHGQVNASPSFKKKLLVQLMQQARAIKVRRTRKTWNRPLVWVPVVAAILAIVVIYTTIGMPGKSPDIVAPPPAESHTSPSITPETHPPISETTTSVPSETPPAISQTTTSVPPETTTPSISETTTPVPPETPTTEPLPPEIVEPTPQPSTPTLIASTGFLKILVTDAPPQHDVTEINVILSNVQVSKYVEGEDDGTWITVVTEGKELDLIKLRDTSMAALLGNSTLKTGLYLQIRMDVEIIDAVIDGESVNASVSLPSGKLKMVSSFEIKENQTTTVTIDFDTEKSLVFTGEGKVMFKPVVKLLITYE